MSPCGIAVREVYSIATPRPKNNSSAFYYFCLPVRACPVDGMSKEPFGTLVFPLGNKLVVFCARMSDWQWVGPGAALGTPEGALPGLAGKFQNTGSKAQW